MENNKVHILVVDDETLNLEIISEYLLYQNYHVSTAENGQIAWEMLENSQDDL